MISDDLQELEAAGWAPTRLPVRLSQARKGYAPDLEQREAAHVGHGWQHGD